MLAIRENHFSLLTLITLPHAPEDATIGPGHDAVPVSLARLEIALVFGFLIVSAVLGATVRQAIVILHETVAVGPPILKAAVELVTILVVYHG